MDISKSARTTDGGARDEGVAYLLDMIAELAKLARRLDEAAMAIHLEAIVAAEQATRRGSQN